MKKFNPPSFFVCSQVAGGMNENNHIKVSRCVVAMVTAINHTTLKVIF